MLEIEEKNMIRAILEDVKNLKGRVDGMEGMLETLVEIYTDAFYEVKEEYLEKIEKKRVGLIGITNLIFSLRGLILIPI